MSKRYPIRLPDTQPKPFRTARRRKIECGSPLWLALGEKLAADLAAEHAAQP